MSKYFSSRVRVCYEHGDIRTGKKIYEAKQLCHCENCVNRFKWRNEVLNCVTASTYNKSKIEEMLQFLDNWTCKDGTKHIEIEYIHF